MKCFFCGGQFSDDSTRPDVCALPASKAMAQAAPAWASLLAAQIRYTLEASSAISKNPASRHPMTPQPIGTVRFIDGARSDFWVRPSQARATGAPPDPV